MHKEGMCLSIMLSVVQESWLQCRFVKENQELAAVVRLNGIVEGSLIAALVHYVSCPCSTGPDIRDNFVPFRLSQLHTDMKLHSHTAHSQYDLRGPTYALGSSSH